MGDFVELYVFEKMDGTETRHFYFYLKDAILEVKAQN